MTTRASRVTMDPRIARRLTGGPVEIRRNADRTALLEERQRLLDQLSNPPEGADLAELTKRADEVVAELKAIKDADEARARLAGTDVSAERGGDDQRGRQTARPAGVPGADREGEGEDEGQRRGEMPEHFSISEAARRFTEAQGFLDLRDRNFRGEFAMDLPGNVRALLDTTQFADPKTRVPGIVLPKERAPRLLDLIDTQTMSGTSLEYVQEATFSGAGAEVAEGSAKPEDSFTSTIVTTAAATIAAWANITRQAAADNSQVQGYMQGRIARSLTRRLEAQIVNGNGTAPNLRGILQTAGIGTYTAAASEAAVISVRKAKTVAQLSEYEPDTVVMNPTAWERIELSVNTQGSFRVNLNVSSALGPRIWGLNVVTSTVLAAVTFLLGSFGEGATLWERQGLQFYMTDSHASNFTSNILTMLLEMRAALAVWRPAAFVKGTLDAAGN